jgi:phage-related protein
MRFFKGKCNYGASLGAVTAALTIKGTTEKVEKTVKSVGNTVKGASGSFTETVANIGNAIKTIADSVNETVKDVGDAVKDTTAVPLTALQ